MNTSIKFKQMDKIIISNQIFSNALFHSQIQIHVYHLQTRSYSRHEALENFYKKIDKLLDRYIETFQGKYGILNKYNAIDIDNNPENCILYLEGLRNITKNTDIKETDTDLKNIKDEILQLINRTIYKLEYLK